MDKKKGIWIMNDKSFAGNAKESVDFLGNKWRFSCMGCAIANGDIEVPGGIIYQGEATILAADPEIPIPGFLIVNLKRHIRSLSELEQHERHEVIDVIYLAEKALRTLGISEVTLVQEERSSHLHFWIFPTYDWMVEKYGKGIAHLRDISAYAQKTSTEDNKQKVLQVVKDVRKYFDKHMTNH